MKLAAEGGTPVRNAPWPSWPIVDEQDVRAVANVVRGGVWGSTSGEQVRAFEAEFAAYSGVRHGIALNSGTTALQVALRAMGVGPGDEVIVPAYTFVATAAAVSLAGAEPVFADILPDTYNIDPDAVERAITPRTRALIPVHFAGLIADVDRLGDIAQRHGLGLLEDAAHAQGSVFDGQAPGSWGAAAISSFQSSKNLTSGEGGLILTNDDNLAEACRSSVNCGRVKGGVWYEHHVPGGNYRLTEFQGALLRSQMRRLDAQTRRRDANGRILDEGMSRFKGLSALRIDPRQTLHARHLYIFAYNQAEFGLPRDRFVELMRAEGIPVGGGYPMGLHQQPLFIGQAAPGSMPVTEHTCAREAVWLTQNLLLAEPGEMQDVLSAVEKVAASVQ